MGELGAQLRIAFDGFSPIGFQLTDWGFTAEPIFEDGQFIGRRVAIEALGSIEAANPAAFASLVSSTPDLQVAGVMVEVFGAGGMREFALDPATCLRGGPHVSIQILPQSAGAALEKEIKLNINADVMGGPAIFEVRRYSIQRKPDGLLVTQVDGKLIGANAEAYWTTTTLPALAESYDGQVVGWIKRYQVGDQRLEYTFTAEQLAGSLPDDGNQNIAIDGEISIAEDKDDQGRKIKRWSYDLVYEGDPRALVTFLRPGAADAPIITRESMQFSTARQRRLQAMFEAIVSAQEDDLLVWESSLQAPKEGGAATAVDYEGIRTILVAKRTATRRITLSCRAIGLGKYPKPPSLPSAEGWTLESDAVVQLRKISAAEFEMTWSCALVGTRTATDAVIVALNTAIQRPAEPTFYA